MPRVFIPAPLRRLTGGLADVETPGETVRALIDGLESRFPGLRERLCEGERLRTGLTVVIGSALAGSNLMQPVQDDAEVHFIRSVGGG
jgi:molybdopterin synthase sulfur carrier subunit